MDMTNTIIPKSDQLNADDLIAGPRTIRITRVTANESSAEQPVRVHFDGDDDKPYLPCKSMRRVLVNCWGRDASQYAGRRLTLYRDPKVRFGGLEVGGIRISHLSDIEGEMTMALTVTRASRKPYVVRPLRDQPAPKPAAQAPDKQRAAADTMIARVTAAASQDALFAVINDAGVKRWRDGLKQKRPELEAEIAQAVGDAYTRLVPPPDDDAVPQFGETAEVG